MIFGMSLTAFTQLHVALSIIGIVAGFAVAFELLRSRRSSRWTVAFLATTILTSVTGFLFPFTQVLPSHVFGVISLAVLALTIVALYLMQLRGAWRWIFVVSALFALYLNVFVLVVQAFLKVDALKPLAPTQTELPFFIAQGVVLLLFIALIVGGVRSFRPPAPSLQ